MTNETWERACRAAGIEKSPHVVCKDDNCQYSGSIGHHGHDAYPSLGDSATILKIEEWLIDHNCYVGPSTIGYQAWHRFKDIKAKDSTLADAIIECAAAMEGK